MKIQAVVAGQRVRWVLLRRRLRAEASRDTSRAIGLFAVGIGFGAIINSIVDRVFFFFLRLRCLLVLLLVLLLLFLFFVLFLFLFLPIVIIVRTSCLFLYYRRLSHRYRLAGYRG